ncbi:MAG: SDR family oxidoreductase [Solirubrobacterales bacterium]|nr:SDR family oxidoreductase [Solirubrobacterales bacterium]MBV9715182.1 SDR family oxidoreductase [Solirubrobacterales bacterium]
MNSTSGARVALITGAGGGIGAATARALAQRGMRLVLTDSDEDRAAAVAEAHDRDAVAVRHDVRDENGWQSVVELAQRRFGRLDVLVNNAGVFLAAPMRETTPEAFRRVLDINTTGVFLGMRAAAPMLEHSGGLIINVSSVAGLAGTSHLAAYSASKWAVRGLSRVAARELAPHGIRVITVLPGQIDTEMNARQRSATPAWIDAIIRATPMRRLGSPDEIAETIALLASGASTYMTGAEITIDGGLTA